MADRISTLPDEVHSHILSFLPTQNAITTSVLSKGWKPLWRSVPTLFFDDQTYLINDKPYDSFSKFIYRTILNRDMQKPITSFRLQCGHSNFNLSDSDVTTWVNAAMQSGIENLHIELPSSSDPVRLRSSSIFSCKTLVVLKLIALDVDVFSISDLPFLKTLHLDYVEFRGPNYLMKLLSGCPVLEDLRLTRIYCAGSDSPRPSNKNLKSLSKLVRADIFRIGPNFALKVICNVEFLRIDKYPDADDNPVFPNLTHVELMFGTGMNWDLVLAMLKNWPKLQKLSLDMVESDTDMVWNSPFNVPECLFSQLRKCSITNYSGTESEQQFAKYMMKNSGVLQTMTICTACSSKLQDKFEMLKELSSCPRSSAICELLFK
ncbi:FBD-associated F-box protein At5g56370-like [Lotus japonicus]|uniref:FBD-associated F-box protein At5g56370-like n=1 Tax=Lotus japonicus TaxID=34305 RepID=UPI00258F0835|nr:FBD-associated F-box protein At5g56370-like [Lotus japonicus]